MSKSNKNNKKISFKLVVYCEYCKHRKTTECPMYYEEYIDCHDDGYHDFDYVAHDNTKDDGFCHLGELADTNLDNDLIF